ncbi:MAG: CPBP family intramembrane metalloprotease [Candidatus Lokiarchaeota archaeon]|nr:CPBP family intramembrane metalloprotease [Candidatus Lokiarchaeota archaeon]MBD3200753.1 CPBP family intramembrane metalloprotease [Candidatus Lokiarchaeota archaeon]
MNETHEKSEEKTQENNWKYCPRCGAELPPIDDIKYCTRCGLDIAYLKKYNKVPSDSISKVDIKKDERPKLTEDEIFTKKEGRIWDNPASIFIPLGAFGAMELAVSIIILPLIFFIPMNQLLNDILNSTVFLIVFSLFEYIFILIPFLYVGLFLERPTIGNRLAILGLTTKRKTGLETIQEILLGVIFAIIALILVNLISLFLEFIMSFFFNLESIFGTQTPTSETDLYIASSNIIEIVLLVIIMIVVIGPSEEVAFRGFMQKGLSRTLGRNLGLIITALIFTGIHLISIAVIALESAIGAIVAFILLFFPYFVISLLLGYLFIWRNENLIAPTITHGIYNSLTVLMGFLVFNYSLFTFGIFSLITFGIFFISIALYFILNYIKQQNQGVVEI